MKVCILGYSGCGKSTLAKAISEKYGVPALYLDTVHYTANWVERDKDECKRIVRDFLENKSWVIDGNYTKLYQEERLEACDYIVIMDFNRVTCLWRAFKRFIAYRGKSRESMAEGCNEKLDWAFIKWIMWDSRVNGRPQRFEKIRRDYKEKTYVIKNQRELTAFTQAPFQTQFRA